MNTYSPEPLTPEERELAQLTARLGPQGEPSPALDARILAAAHAALDSKPASRRKPRWPVAMGLAASVMLAVGIAWQLRPLQQAPVVASEAPANALPDQAAQADSAQAATSAPAPEAEAASREPAAALAPEPALQPPQAPPASAKSLPPPAGPAQTPRRLARPPAPEAPPLPRWAHEASTPSPPPSPPAPPAPVTASAPAPTAVAEPSIAFAPDPRESYSEQAAAADNAGLGAGTLAARQQHGDAQNEMKAKAVHARESVALDRVEVSGSRLRRTDLQVPVSDDARLPVNEWLECVRTRYGLGDADAAKKSLLLFMKDHPGEPVPGDLEPLLEE